MQVHSFVCVYDYQCHKTASQNGAIHRLYQKYILYTSAGFRVTIKEKTKTAFTPEATRGVHTAVFTSMVTLAFVDVCINTGVATDGHRRNAMHIHPQVVVHSPLHVRWSEFNL